MAQQFWIGGFYIDLSRNQITQNKESQTLAPKALSVLTYLAKNQGQVVSQDELMEHVWQGIIVSPNTLQRSIAQLRKALGDDGKIQVYIKTHAKKGYSLECDVRWNEQLENIVNEEASQIDALNTPIESTASESSKIADKQESSETPKQHAIPSISNRVTFFLLIATITIISLFYAITPSISYPKLNIGEIRALTATDNKEVDGIYSPDGNYVVFHRYSNEFCQNNIWAKNIETQEEFQLTNNLNSYGSHSFSKDGKSLVFIQSQTCDEPISQKMCYHLMSLDFHKALLAPQQPSTLLECKNSVIRDAKWLNNNRIALLQKNTQRWKLTSYSPSENKSETIYRVDKGNIIDYDYSARDNLISIVSIKQDNRYYLTILTPSGEIVSHVHINYPKEISRFRPISPNFSPLEQQLIFSTGRQLYTLSYDGKVNRISLPLDRAMGSPVLHPNGDRMLATKGNFDDDIVSVSISELRVDKAPNNYRVLERSNVGDSKAILQPNGELMAFSTQRSGQTHIWLSNGKKANKFSSFPMDTLLYDFVWADDGTSILTNTDKQLIKLSLSGEASSYPLQAPIEQLFDWDISTDTVIANIKINGISTFAKVNLKSANYSVINDKQISHALKDSNGRIIYTDHMDRFWLEGPLEDTIIEALSKQGSNKGFIIKDDVIYGINEDFQIWTYQLNSHEFTVIGKAPKNTTAITDVTSKDIILTVFITGKKEIAELFLEN